MINIFKPCSNMFKVAVSLSSSIMQYSASVAGNCWHGHMWSQFLGEIYRLSDEKVWWPPPPNNPNTPTSASSPWSPVSSDLCLLQPFAAAQDRRSASKLPELGKPETMRQAYRMRPNRTKQDPAGAYAV